MTASREPDGEPPVTAQEAEPDLDGTSEQAGEVRRAPAGEDDAPTDGTDVLNPA